MEPKTALSELTMCRRPSFLQWFSSVRHSGYRWERSHALATSVSCSAVMLCTKVCGLVMVFPWYTVTLPSCSQQSSSITRLPRMRQRERASGHESELSWFPIR
jgi:hypothetical protein